MGDWLPSLGADGNQSQGQRWVRAQARSRSTLVGGLPVDGEVETGLLGACRDAEPEDQPTTLTMMNVATTA
jgi:hypothetical protein